MGARLKLGWTRRDGVDRIKGAAGKGRGSKWSAREKGETRNKEPIAQDSPLAGPAKPDYSARLAAN